VLSQLSAPKESNREKPSKATDEGEVRERKNEHAGRLGEARNGVLPGSLLVSEANPHSV
jgi:hypothetical protein